MFPVPLAQEVQKMNASKLAAAIGIFLSLAAAAPALAVAKDGRDNPPTDVRHGGDDGPHHR